VPKRGGFFVEVVVISKTENGDQIYDSGAILEGMGGAVAG